MIAEGFKLQTDAVSPTRFVCTLLSLTQYQYSALSMRAFSILSQHFSQRMTFIEAMQSQELLVSGEICSTVRLLQAYATATHACTDTSQM